MAEAMILVASADPSSWQRTKEALSQTYAVTFAVDLQGVLEVLRKHKPPLLVLGSRLLNTDLQTSWGRLQSRLGSTRVVAILSRDDPPGRALELGVDACLQEDLVPTGLLPLVRSLLPREDQASASPRGVRGADESPTLTPIDVGHQMVLGHSPAMQELMARAKRIAATEVTVLIRGESGTGKELLARWMHQMSPRAGGPFEAINLPAVPGELFESILFGHERGSFTGATAPHAGKFQRAQNGTLFLDEVSSLKLELQPKLLRALQEREVESVGGREPIACNARVIAATNTSLAELVRRGDFREDLYYRLEVIPLELPPLRQRAEDIPELVGFFLEKYSRKFAMEQPAVSPATLSALRAYPWPGNCRELENRTQRALFLGKPGQLEAEDFLVGETTAPLRPAATEDAPVAFGACTHSLGEIDAMYIREVLRQTGGNHTQAAQVLQIDRKTLRAKLQRGEETGEPQALRSVS